MCILIGPSKAGKTSFINKLQNDGILSVQQPSSKQKEKNVSMPKYVITFGGRSLKTNIHELNCQLNSQASLLKDDCNAILYMIDSTNRSQISEAFICLLELLKNKDLSDIPVLILLNKQDETEAFTRDEVEKYFHMKEVLHWATKPDSTPNDVTGGRIKSEENSKRNSRKVNLIECSVLKGIGIERALTWLLCVCLGEGG